jgi:hypothetical protein
MDFAPGFDARRRQATAGQPQVAPVFVPVEEQRVSNWCWLATTVSVAHFQGERVDQCWLADTLLGQNRCCAEPYSVPCNRQGRVEQALAKIERLADTIALSGIVPELADIQRELDDRRPPIGQFEFAAGGQHAVLLAGYGINAAGQDVVHIGDPAPGWNPSEVVWERAGEYRDGVSWTYVCWTA